MPTSASDHDDADAVEASHESAQLVVLRRTLSSLEGRQRRQERDEHKLIPMIATVTPEFGMARVFVSWFYSARTLRNDPHGFGARRPRCFSRE